MTATLNQLNAAANDPDLRARLELAAAEAVIAPTDVASRQLVWDRIIAVISAPLANGTSIMDAYAYADDVRSEALAQVPPPPGSNPAAVNDDMLREAVRSVLSKDGGSEA